MLPITFNLAEYPTADTIRLLASLLERMTKANDLLRTQQSLANSTAAAVVASSVPQHKQIQLSTSFQQVPVTNRFRAQLVPSIDIYSYLTRILKYCPCANECFLSLLVYFDRMSKNSLALTGQPFTIDSFNIHRLIIAGIMVSSKFFSDMFFTSSRYAKVGGLSVTELNLLEIEFLKLNSFSMTVPISELQKYGDQLLKVEYMTQELQKPFRHNRSSSLDQVRSELNHVFDLTQRMSLDEQQRYHYHQQLQQLQQQKRNGNGHWSVRRMTSTSSLVENRYSSPRHSYSSVNLQQGFWESGNLLQQKQQSNDGISSNNVYKKQTESAFATTKRSSCSLSLDSIHAPPFIPNSELQRQQKYQQQQRQQQSMHQQQRQQQQQQQQQQHVGNEVYCHRPTGIPTPPPSASPV